MSVISCDDKVAVEWVCQKLNAEVNRAMLR